MSLIKNTTYYRSYGGGVPGFKILIASIDHLLW